MPCKAASEGIFLDITSNAVSISGSLRREAKLPDHWVDFDHNVDRAWRASSSWTLSRPRRYDNWSSIVGTRERSGWHAEKWTLPSDWRLFTVRLYRASVFVLARHVLILDQRVGEVSVAVSVMVAEDNSRRVDNM